MKFFTKNNDVNTQMDPLISVAIPTYNRSQDLKLCLDSIMRQTYRNFEIVVIDNGSTDDTANILKNYKLKVIKDETKNLAYLFNLAISNSSGKYIAYINDDAEADISWLENIIKSFSEYEADLVGGPTIATREQEISGTYDLAQRSFLLKIFAKIYNIVVCEGHLFDIGKIFQSGAYSIGGSHSYSMKLKDPFFVDFLSIIGVAIKRDVFNKLSFDENFIWVHGDGDFFIQAKKLGFRLLFNPKVVVWHNLNPGGATRGSFNLGNDYAYFLSKNFKPNNFFGLLRFCFNIIFFNFFWIFKAFQLKSSKPLEGIKGFFFGVHRYFVIGLEGLK